MSKIMYADNGMAHIVNGDLVDIIYSPEGIFRFVYNVSGINHMHTFEINSTLKGINVVSVLSKMLSRTWKRVEQGYYVPSGVRNIETFERIVGSIEEDYNKGNFE